MTAWVFRICLGDDKANEATNMWVGTIDCELVPALSTSTCFLDVPPPFGNVWRPLHSAAFEGLTVENSS